MSIQSDKLMNLADGQVLYNDLRDRNEALSGDIAVKYENLTFPVAQGKHCIHDGKLYSAKQPIQNSENWNASHWDQVVLGDEVSALSNALNQSNAATNSDIGKAHSPKTVVDGKVTEWQYVEVGGGGGGDLPSDFPTDETAQELLEYETYNAGLTDTALAVIGMLFTNLPQDETATDILHSLELECERLDLIYNGWIAEREGA